MIHKLITAAALGVSLAGPAQAIPTYAHVVARSHCEYLRYGTPWEDAMVQSLREAMRIYNDEMERDGAMSNRAIFIAIDGMCKELNDRAWDEMKANES